MSFVNHDGAKKCIGAKKYNDLLSFNSFVHELRNAYTSLGWVEVTGLGSKA